MATVQMLTISPAVTCAAQFAVNATGDGADISPGDSLCETASSQCTLRAAIMEANAHPGDDVIQFDLPAGSIINLTTALPDITNNLDIIGPGADLLTLKRNLGGNYRIFNVTAVGTVTIARITISNGIVSSAGGAGIANATGTVNITNCIFSGNSASNNGAGGGIFNSIGTVNVTNCTLTGNSAVNGGGIFNSGGTVNVSNSTISGNSAVDGAGIYSSSGTLTVTNSTISGNTASSTGGGIHSDAGGINLVNATISNNGAVQGGGFDNTDAIARARNTIVATNTVTTSGPDISGAVTSQGHNLIGNNSGALLTPTTGDQIGTAGSPIDPLLDPLHDNGGPTLTHALLSGSPAINAGNDATAPPTDQRGYLRNATSDIGAFEFAGAPIRITSVTRHPNDHILLEGIGVPNAAHTIEVLPNLSPNSTPSPVPVMASETGALEFDDAGAAGLTKRFYRLRFP